MPTAIAVDAGLGLLFWTDAGTEAKLWVADMDGMNPRVIVRDLIFYPTSVAVDYAKQHRVYWADPKRAVIESVLPDGSDRVLIVRDVGKKPFKLDLFENWIYWLAEETNELLKVDKFGHGTSQVLIEHVHSPHAVKIYHKLRYNVSLENPCANANAGCSHLCLPIPGHSHSCACPHGTQFDGRSDTDCMADIVSPKGTPKPCKANGTCEEGTGGQGTGASGVQKKPKPQGDRIGKRARKMFGHS